MSVGAFAEARLIIELLKYSGWLKKVIQGITVDERQSLEETCFGKGSKREHTKPAKNSATPLSSVVPIYRDEGWMRSLRKESGVRNSAISGQKKRDAGPVAA